MNTPHRITIRVGLGVSFALSVLVIVAAAGALGRHDKEAWSVIAASLAVITSVISAWTAQRVLELQEDSQRAYPYPSIDVTTRYLSFQLRVTNYGAGVAHDVRIRWDTPLRNLAGEIVRFAEGDAAPDIPVLLPHESVAVFVDGALQMYQKYNDMVYQGSIEFKDEAGQLRQHSFRISGEQYRNALTSSTEEAHLQHELAKVPEKLDAIVKAINALAGSRGAP